MPSRRLHLTFPEDLVQQPIVWRLVRDHDLVINIRRADVDAEVGWMILEITGEERDLDAGEQWLRDIGVIVSDPGGDVVAG